MQFYFAHNGVQDGHPNETGAVKADSTINTTISDVPVSTSQQSGGSPMLTIVIVLIVVAVAAVGAFMFIKRKKNKVAVSGPSETPPTEPLLADTPSPTPTQQNIPPASSDQTPPPSLTLTQ